MKTLPLLFCSLAAVGLHGCAATGDTGPSVPATKALAFGNVNETVHRGVDDLLTAGLGLEGLRSPTGPALQDPSAPTPAEARRRAIWSSWRGIADLAPGGGFGEVYGSLAAVPGREFSALARLPGAHQSHRVLVQVPDAFDRAKPCLVVTASSGSRGVYGAISVAGSWGLARGCAVAYTDKGTGSDYYDLDAGVGFALEGTPASSGDLAFVPPDGSVGPGIAFKHAHSGDNPEADWGRHIRQAAQFGLEVLDRAFPEAAPFTPQGTRTIAVGVSNGGGAVLRAAELEGDWLDGVVAGEPNVSPAGAEAAPLYEFMTRAALLMPCALLAVEDLPQPPVLAQANAGRESRCAALKAAGLVDGADVASQARAARDGLLVDGVDESVLRAGAFSVGFDMWRAIAVTYASAYGRYAPGQHPCGYRFSAAGADGKPRAALAGERALWWSDASGIPPGTGVVLVESGPVPALHPEMPGLLCLRDLWTGSGEHAQRVRAGIAQTLVQAPRRGLPIWVVHGTEDGLVPNALTSEAYVRMARAQGASIAYWRIHKAQHFDAALVFPDYRRRYVPMLPYVFAALDQLWAHLEAPASLALQDADVDAEPRGEQPLRREQLRVPVSR